MQTRDIAPKRLAKLREIKERFEEVDPHLSAGVCCFGRDLRTLLLWSHYTQSHQGVCLFYKIPANYFWNRYRPKEGPQGRTDDMFFVGGSRVYYGDDVFTRWLAGGNLNKPHPGEHVENAVTRIFASKAEGWGYEEEWRIVTSAPGKLGFEPTFLKDITFGLHTLPEHKARIAEIARNNNPDVIFRQAEKSTTRDFGLEFREIEV